MMQLIRNDMNIPFTKIRWIGFAFSAVLMTLGLYATLQLSLGRAKMGVEFSGGTTVEVEFPKAIKTEEVRNALKADEFQDSSIQTIADPGRYKFMLRIQATSLKTSEVSTRVLQVLQKNLPDNPAVILASEDVGPSVSAHLRQQALFALFWAMVGIVIYIWWRFDFRFSVAATLATIHDILAVLGIMYLLGFEMNLLLLTALLTIAGYSLNDTVVVFDRIRENLRHDRKAEYDGLVNRSINETLSRTIVTSLATMLVVIALLFLGGEVIYTFSLAMTIGLVIGTYSTIFVASNFISEWNARSPVPR
ncbi:MAG: protein translocase subunit SecF [candidate division FCPU426 bacterium]